MKPRKFNDRTNPQIVMVGYQVPKQIHVVIARALKIQPSPGLAGYVDRATNQFFFKEIPL